MEMNIEDEELVKMINPTLKRREAILFFLIVVINGLKCIVSDIGLDTSARGGWRVDFPFGPIHSSETPYLTINYVTLAHQINIQQLIL